MGRVAKKAPETPKAVIEESQTVTLTRAKRTPKPNPKYANDSIVIPPKIESSESNGSSDIEDKLPETKIVKSTKKIITKNEDSSVRSKIIAKGKASVITVVKKQKIEFDDDEKTKDADEIPPIPSPPLGRATRSGKTDSKDEKSEIKVGDESVAIIDVSSIIGKTSVKIEKQETPKNLRGTGRKRQAAEVIEIKEDSPKKKKEDEKPSLITARKSYMPATMKKSDGKTEDEDSEEIKDEPVEIKTPVSTMKTRRNAGTPQSAEPVEKKAKIEVIKGEPIMKNANVEPKKLPMMVRKEQITKVSPMTPTLPTKTVNNVIISAPSGPKPAPRLLNSMITPKGAKLSPNVKLAGDGTDRKVFSIEMSDGSIIEKKEGIKSLASPVKSPPSAVKENVAINKPQPSVLLKNKLESELSRMKASASLMKRQIYTAPQVRHSLTQSPQHIQTNVTSSGARRITKFESWYVIDVKNQEAILPLKHTHSHSLIRLGNKIKELQLPSLKWDYKVTLQRRQDRKQNNNDDDDEVYTGEVGDKTNEAEKQNFEPNCILFKRSHRDNNRVTIDRSLMLKQNMYTITMNGKQCHLVGAPDDIKSIEDLEILLKIIDTSSATHSCVHVAC